MKKNILKLFFNKMSDFPLWVKQVVFLRLVDEMKEIGCYDYLINNRSDIFSTYIPILTFSGKTELAERNCGLDNNIYNFLQYCAIGLSILEISLNTFLSLEEVAKCFEFCLEQGFINAPESAEVNAIAGYVAGKYRLGEYFTHNGSISVEKQKMAVKKYKEALKDNPNIKFGEIMLQTGIVNENELRLVLNLKKESKKRFILDCSQIPTPELKYSSDNQKYEDEINQLKQENSELRQKMSKLLDLMRQDGNSEI